MKYEKYMMMGSNIRAITNFGLWPSDVKNYPILNKLHKVYSITMLLIFLTFFITSYIELFFIYNNIIQLMYNLSISLLYVIIMAKISMLLFDRKTVAELLERTRLFQEFVFNGPNERNKEIFVKYVKITDNVSKFFWTVVFITVNALITPGFLAIFGYYNKIEEDGTVTKTLPFSLKLPFDAQKYHTTAYIMQALMCIPGTAYVAIWDTFIYALIMTAICQLKVLQNSLIQLGEYGVKSVYDTAVDCVKYHQEIIKYVNDLDSLVTTIMFLDFVVYAILLCSIGFRAIFDENIDLPQFVSNINYLGAVLVQLYMIYWTGNQLMLESVAVASAAWESKWYLYDKRLGKLLLILMMRAQKPLKISVGRFYNMNLESLLVILRAWYSYLTLLNQVSNEET